MMGFSKDDRERGVTSGELVSCAPAPDSKLGCAECGLPYVSDKWCDCVLDNDTWAKVFPEHSGVLCFNCIAGRLVKLGMERVPITIRSGPFLLAWDDEGQLARISALEQALEHITELFVDCAKLGHDPEKEVAVINARAVLKSKE